MSFKLPFRWMPGSWGLKGKTREIAQAEYELTGYDLDKKIAHINFDGDEINLQKTLLSVDLKWNKISQFEFDTKLASLSITNDKEKLLSDNDLKLKHGLISETQHERNRADILEEPWVAMPTIKWDPLNNGRTYFQLDYNDFFVEFLRKNGYLGSEDDILHQWLNDICISISEEITGLPINLNTPTRREVF